MAVMKGFVASGFPSQIVSGLDAIGQSLTVSDGFSVSVTEHAPHHQSYICVLNRLESGTRICGMRIWLSGWHLEHGWRSTCEWTGEDISERELASLHDMVTDELDRAGIIVAKNLDHVERRQHTGKRGGYGPRPDTIRLIKEVRLLRRTKFVSSGKIPGWLKTCDEIGITASRVKHWAGELRENWYVPEYDMD